MPERVETSGQVRLFYSYSHKDEALRDEIEKHLAILRQQGIISEWHDRKITGGADWDSEIDSNLKKAQLVLLLVSSDFMASDYCRGREMELALFRHRQGAARVIPVMLRPFDLAGTGLEHIQAIPRDGKAIVLWESQDEALQDVGRQLRLVCEEIGQRRLQTPEIPYASARVGDETNYELTMQRKGLFGRTFTGTARHRVISKTPTHIVVQSRVELGGQKFNKRSKLRLDIPAEDSVGAVVGQWVEGTGEGVPAGANVRVEEEERTEQKLLVGQNTFYCTRVMRRGIVELGAQQMTCVGTTWTCPDVPIEGLVKMDQEYPTHSMSAILVSFRRGRVSDEGPSGDPWWERLRSALAEVWSRLRR